MMPRREMAELLRHESGVAAVEFAIVAPVLFALLFGIVQLGMMFNAQAGLRNSVEDTARFATTWPKPTAVSLQTRSASNRFGLDPARIGGPTITFSSGATPNYVTISMTYSFTLNYIMGSQTIVLSESRKAFTVS